MNICKKIYKTLIMSKYRFTLEPYNGMDSRYTCPSCGQYGTFTRYIDTKTDEYLSYEVGRCNRENKCGYHYPPKKFFAANNITVKKVTSPVSKKETKGTTSFIPSENMSESFNQYEKNNFVIYLDTLLGEELTSEAVMQYNIGTSSYWKGATVFWQADYAGKIRTGKIMLYDKNTGKRVKKPYNHINWMHSVLKLKNFNLRQCFFGEHLLKGSREPVAIVESEKTAIIASIHFPEFIWLAAGSASNLSKEKFKVLQGRTVILYPDLGCYKKWRAKAQELSPFADISVSELLEKNVSDDEREQGYDIADYLAKFNCQ